MRTEVIQHFHKKDRIIYSLLLKKPQVYRLQQAEPETFFYRLVREIAFQQLSNKAGTTIFARFAALFQNKKITPAKVLKLPHEAIRAAGLSNSKAAYIRNIAEAADSGSLNFAQLPELEDAEIIRILTQIKGIGRWTAEMFLIFTLGRENVFSMGDLGLRKGFVKAYRLKKQATDRQIMRTIENWAPFKSYGSLALWDILDNR